MTLDELIEALTDLRRQCPAAGTASVGTDWEVDEITYDRGMVWLGADDETGETDCEYDDC